MSRYLERKPYHICHVVPDLAAAVDRLLASGFGPAFHFHSVSVDARYRGARNTVQLSAAFVAVGGTLIEILQQENDAPSAYREYLARHPDGGLHHVAYISETLEQGVAEARTRGFDLVAVEEFLGPDGAPFEVYYEPRGAEDPVYIQFALPSPLDDVFAEIRLIGGEWDGKTEPKRDIMKLMTAKLPTSQPA